MPLPVLSAARTVTDADLVRLFHKTGRAWAEHLGEATQLDAGVAVVAPDLPEVPGANCVLEAAVPPGRSAADAVAEIDAHFAAADAAAVAGSPTGYWPSVRHRVWELSPSAPPDRTAPLAALLLERGLTAATCDVMVLGPAARPTAPPPAGVTILPARAALRHARGLAAEEATGRPARLTGPPGTGSTVPVALRVVGDRGECPPADAQEVDAHLRHLDDPHVDALLALRDGRAVGRVLVLAVGDLGRVEDLYVAPAARRQGVGRALLARAIEVCARSAFRHVLLGIRPDNADAVRLYRAFGFRRVGSATAYW